MSTLESRELDELQAQPGPIADWIRRAFKQEPSLFGTRVLAVLSATYGGLHHLDVARLRRVRWSALDYIEVTLGSKEGLATWDFDVLTVLVVLAHDACIRLEVRPGGQYLKLLFHPRRGRVGSMSRRHPCLEEHVALIRDRCRLRLPEAPPGACRVCGCTAERACDAGGVGCSWTVLPTATAPGLCSVCAPYQAPCAPHQTPAAVAGGAL
jgi:hypothetical protein